MDQIIRRRCLVHVFRSRVLGLRYSSTTATSHNKTIQAPWNITNNDQKSRTNRPSPTATSKQPPTPTTTTKSPPSSDSIALQSPPPPSSLHSYTLTSPPTNPELAYTTRYFSSPTSPPILLWTHQKFLKIPRSPYPEICFVGRSNVGKSSLLNALFNRTTVSPARVSSKPGHTRTLNGFGVGGHSRDPLAKEPLKQLGPGALVVVDTPGYGKGSRNEWGSEIEKYFLKRQQLRKVFVLVDAEHGLKKTDLELIGHFERNSVPYQVLLSKADKVVDVEANKSPSVGRLSKGVEKLRVKMDEVERKLEELVPQGGRKVQRDILCVSAEKGIMGHGWPRGRMGVDAVRWAALKACGLECDENGQRKVMEEMNILWEDDE